MSEAQLRACFGAAFDCGTALHEGADGSAFTLVTSIEAATDLRVLR
jgi:hypothetical protein